MWFIFHSPQWVLIYAFKNFGYEIIARPSVRPHLGVSRRKMSHWLTRIMDKSLRSNLHLWCFVHYHTCPTPPPTHKKQNFSRVSILHRVVGRDNIYQWYHVIKYSCSNCITYQSFSIFNLHARFLSWFLPNTDNWWGGRTTSYFQKFALFYKDIQKWEKITNTTSLSQELLSRIIGI